MMLRHLVTTTSSLPELRAAVEILGATIQCGETYRGVCPKCGGGQSNEKSFRLSRDLGSVCRYNCFRASCNFYGKHTLGYSQHDHTQERADRARPFDHPVEAINAQDVDMFRAVFGITPDRDTYWCPARDRYAHRVYGPVGKQRGWVLRDYTGEKPSDNFPKAIAYPYSNLTGPFVSWYYPVVPLGDDVVVVEDILSAKKVADSGFKSVALLGTYMSLEMAYEIAHEAGKAPVHLALDEGTMGLMIRYRDKFEIILGDVRIWSLKKDLKYVPRNRIRKAIKDGKIDFRSDAGEESQP